MINRREKYLLQATVVLLFLVLLYTMLLEPQMARLNKAQLHQKELEQNLYKLQADYQIKDQTEKLHARVISMLNEGKSDQQEISAFSQQLNQIYHSLNLSIKSIKILPLLREKHTRKLMMKIELSGHIKNVCELIIRMLNQKEPVKIEQFDCQATDMSSRINASLLVSKVVAPLREN